MHTIHRLSLLLSPLLIAACAATAPPATEFPVGARTPSAAELTTLLRGKTASTPLPNGGTVRVDFAADSNQVTAYVGGRSDTGTWRAEDGRACYDWKVFNSGCGEMRLVGQSLYVKRSNGDVVPVTIAR
ncbi:MAG TPA: hypothetical protein PKA16_03230 [Ottowia sp.]|uniref:DUF995 domain-containing protein n=1 Tax=Ottowia sp. TaxID=1898956 RepID=UPI002C207764|nr:hypothetical protein [Ottowia sp.]HMN20385.1 hypothetical protein [Ottowia sp.]